MTTLKRLLPHAWRQSLKRKLFHHHDMGSRLENLRHAGFQPEILVDVGAFEGSWTRECKQVWPNAKVLMIEPLPHKRKKLERTADELSNVSMISCALSEQTGNVGFRSAETNSAIQIE